MPGAFAQEGQVLFHIADRRVLWLELRVVESEAARIVSPSGAVFHIDGVERGFEIITDKNGRLIAAGAVVDAATRTLPVVFELAQPDAALRIGMAVKAQVFLGPSRQAVAVPTTAVIDENGAATVFMQTAGESFRRRPVRLGARDGDWVEIVDGLEPGQRVVSRGAYLVKLASTATGAIPHGHAH
jgi:multidrug efflux pump subunit AcrA (membrane-fusion protein)